MSAVCAGFPIKTFLFPSCCSEQFCSCLLRKSPALASDQQIVSGRHDFRRVSSESNTPSSLEYNQRADIMKLCRNIWKRHFPPTCDFCIKFRDSVKNPSSKNPKHLLLSLCDYSCIFSCLSGYQENMLTQVGVAAPLRCLLLRC